jgi:adenylylsulfate kinase
MTENIFSIKHKLLQKSDKENLLGHKGIVLWMCGLSGSGKSTLASALESELYAKNIHSKLLDGDNLRTGINSNLGFSENDRTENIRRAAEISKLFVENGEVVICSLISPTNAIRKMAKEIIGEESYREIYINASFDECAKRDVKGLYKKALAGEIKNFTGLDSPFEAPETPFLELNTGSKSLEECKDLLLKTVLEEIKL